MPKWQENKQKGGANPGKFLVEFKLLFDLSDHCEVFKGSKSAVLGQIRPRWAPMKSSKYLEVCENVL